MVEYNNNPIIISVKKLILKEHHRPYTHLQISMLGSKMQRGPALVIEDVDPRLISQQIIHHTNVSLVSSDQQRCPAHGVLSVQRLLHIARRHVFDHLGQDLVVADLGATVERRLLGMLRLQRHVGPGFDEDAHYGTVVAYTRHFRGLDLRRVVQGAGALEGEAVYVAGDVDGLLVLDEADEVLDDGSAAAFAGHVQRCLAVLWCIVRAIVILYILLLSKVKLIFN